MRYAQLDANNIAIGFSDLSGMVDAPNMILIGDNEDFTGWSYNGGVWTAPAATVIDLSAQVNAERDRRIAAGTTVIVTGYGPIPLQGGERDQTNILGLVTASQIRLAGGDNTTITKFRDATNTDHMLTPSQIIEMWSKGAAWISANYDASWTLKGMDPVPADFADDSYWP